MLFGSDRQRMRQVFAESWRKACAREPLEPLESIVAEVVAVHPEYHALLAGPAGLERDFAVGSGESNPFLHMAMHVAVREQVASDRPPGITSVFAGLRPRYPDRHALEHAVMECLGRSLWESQRGGYPPDEAAYLECVRRLAPARARS